MVFDRRGEHPWTCGFVFFLNPGGNGYCTSEQLFSAAVKVGNLTQHSVVNKIPQSCNYIVVRGASWISGEEKELRA